MGKQRARRPGQIGAYWLSQKSRDDRDDQTWHRTWYDASARQTRRVSLGTEDFQEAGERLAGWVVANERSEKAARDEVLIDAVLINYWNDHAKHLPSATTQLKCIQRWQDFWTTKTVAEITPSEQRRFREWMTKQGTGLSGIDRILSVGRAALNRARKWEEIKDVPHIFGTVTAEAKRAREPKGRPITPEDLAKLFDAARSRHMLAFLMIAANTLARPAAILDLRPEQFDEAHSLLNLNPPGRQQNKTHRPIVPVTDTLLPWLKREVGESNRYVNYRGNSVQSIIHMWRITRADAKLDDRVTPYSIRHGMARELRKRKVPTEQISLFLGHIPSGSAATTSIYAPYDPDFLSDAKAAIEDVMAEVRKHLKHAQIDRPDIDPADVLPSLATPYKRGVGEKKREEVRFLILSGVAHAEVVRRSGVSSGTVSAIRTDIKAKIALYRSNDLPICVPIACPNENESGEAFPQVPEMIGGPGRTRTCDQTVMSGPL